MYKVDGAARGTDGDAGWSCCAHAADTELAEADGPQRLAGSEAAPACHHSELLRHLRALLNAVLVGQITVLNAYQA